MVKTLKQAGTLRWFAVMQTRSVLVRLRFELIALIGCDQSWCALACYPHFTEFVGAIRDGHVDYLFGFGPSRVSINRGACNRCSDEGAYETGLGYGKFSWQEFVEAINSRLLAGHARFALFGYVILGQTYRCQISWHVAFGPGCNLE